jgi:UDP-2-acetamido-3-amino-2,3-dideoxy-glucuronate N-acetyltransferase
VHPSAEVEPGARLGRGAVVWRFCHVMSGAVVGDRASLGQGCFVAGGARVGARCKVQNNVSLYDGVTLDDDVFVGPSAVFTNVKRPRAAFPTGRAAYARTFVGRGASVGANATVVCGVRLGPGAMIGAGAVVTRDVPPFCLALGAPARVVGPVCACGERPAPCGGGAYVCPRCGARWVPDGPGFRPEPLGPLAGRARRGGASAPRGAISSASHLGPTRRTSKDFERWGRPEPVEARRHVTPVRAFRAAAMPGAAAGVAKHFDARGRRGRSEALRCPGPPRA